MISLRKITDSEDKDFQKLMELYQEAFPEEERRDLAQLGAMLQAEQRMSFNAVECDGSLAGLFVYWDFGTFYYLEHLAVYPDMRNKKIGQQVLDWIKGNLQGLRLLEVERAETEMAIRRVHYYERNGYRVLDDAYMQPPYRQGGEDYPLWLMGNHSDADLAAKVEVLKHRCKCFGFYAVFLKEKIHGQITYGRSKYDYQEGPLVFTAPGQVGGINDGGETVHPQGYALLFHPDLIRGTSLAGKMKDYTFFSYEANEALHMSERERQTVFTCFAEIREELGHAIDKHSRSIIVSNIEVLLNHCLRFYDRQSGGVSLFRGIAGIENAAEYYRCGQRCCSRQAGSGIPEPYQDASVLFPRHFSRAGTVQTRPDAVPDEFGNIFPSFFKDGPYLQIEFFVFVKHFPVL